MRTVLLRALAQVSSWRRLQSILRRGLPLTKAVADVERESTPQDCIYPHDSLGP
jgi:hypothetical protein